MGLGAFYVVYGNPLWRWGLAFGVALLAYLGLRLLKTTIQHHVAELASRTPNAVDDLLTELLQKRTHWWFLAIIALYLGSLTVFLAERASEVARAALLMALFLQAAFWGDGLNLGLYRRFSENGVQFAYPTQTIHLVRPAGSPDASRVEP